jgi:hypothetical protein
MFTNLNFRFCYMGIVILNLPVLQDWQQYFNSDMTVQDVLSKNITMLDQLDCVHASLQFCNAWLVKVNYLM